MSATDDINRLGTRSLLLTISSASYPDLVERLTDFLQDRGAIGILLRAYNDGEAIEEVALRYWSSRLERTAARLEDLVTTTLISIAASVVAGIIVEFWKGNPGFLGKLFKTADRTQLELAAAKQIQAETDLRTLLALYVSKGRDAGVGNATAARQLYEAVREGLTIAEAIELQKESFPAVPTFEPIKRLHDVARGVVLTEAQRENTSSLPVYSMQLKGLPLCDQTGFGEVIRPSQFNDADPLEMLRKLRKVLAKDRLYPLVWPEDSSFSGISPKVLPLDNQLYGALHSMGSEGIMCELGGVISKDGGMASHVAVMSRSFRIGCIGFSYSQDEIEKSRFALITNGKLNLYFDRPNFTSKDFDILLAYVARPLTAR